MLKNVGYARVIEKLCIFAVRILFINLNKKTFMRKMIATMAACAFMLSTTAFGQSNGPLTKEADGTFVQARIDFTAPASPLGRISRDAQTTR